MKIKRAMAFLLAIAMVQLPVYARDYLTGSLILPAEGSETPVTRKELFTGMYGERYAALPDRQYLILPPSGSDIPQPSTTYTGAGTYRYHYAIAPETSYNKADVQLAAMIRSFEETDGDSSISVLTGAGPQIVYGSYNQKEAKRLFVLMNTARQEVGLHALSWDPTLAEAARQRAAELTYATAHARPDGSDYTTTAEGIAGENTLYGYASSDNAMKRMQELPGRKENILREKFTTVGIACFESDQCTYWAMEFGRQS